MDLILKIRSGSSKVAVMMKRRTKKRMKTKQERKTLGVGSGVEIEEEIRVVVVGESAAFVEAGKKELKGMK